MTMSTVTILAVIALVCFVAALLPAVPEKYVASVGGILLAVAILIGAGG